MEVRLTDMAQAEAVKEGADLVSSYFVRVVDSGEVRLQENERCP